MTRCHHCHCRLTQDDFVRYESLCDRCVNRHMRRWNDKHRAKPARSFRRVAGNILFCLIAATIFVAFMYCMWRAVGGGR